MSLEEPKYNSDAPFLNWQSVPARECWAKKTGVMIPEGVQITWELNDTRWTIRLGIGLAEPSWNPE